MTQMELRHSQKGHRVRPDAPTPRFEIAREKFLTRHAVSEASRMTKQVTTQTALFTAVLHTA